MRHFAFKQDYPSLSFRLITEADIFFPDSTAGPGKKGTNDEKEREKTEKRT
jgi:hypothetical protein